MGILIRNFDNITRVIAWQDEEGTSLTNVLSTMIRDQGKACIIVDIREKQEPITRIFAHEQAAWMLQLQTNPLICINFTQKKSHNNNFQILQCLSFKQIKSACHFLLSPA